MYRVLFHSWNQHLSGRRTGLFTPEQTAPGTGVGRRGLTPDQTSFGEVPDRGVRPEVVHSRINVFGEDEVGKQMLSVQDKGNTIREFKNVTGSFVELGVRMSCQVAIISPAMTWIRSMGSGGQLGLPASFKNAYLLEDKSDTLLNVLPYLISLRPSTLHKTQCNLDTGQPEGQHRFWTSDDISIIRTLAPIWDENFFFLKSAPGVSHSAPPNGSAYS